MCEYDFLWKNIQITWEDDDIDYYVIINKPLSENEYYIPEKTIVFQMEPWVYDETKNWGVKTWGKWAEPDENTFLGVRGRKTECCNNASWQLELKLPEIINLNNTNNTKQDILSSICSKKYFDEGHIKRIDFLHFLENKTGIDLHIYGNDTFKNYKGPLSPYIDKSKGYLNYKYYFMVENNFERNFITEKIWEPILCECLCFYYGCPNISDYIDPNAYVQLDMYDFEKSYNIIKEAILEDLYSKRLPFIKKEKERILNELSFFPVIENYFK
jgi:hypothetical protein